MAKDNYPQISFRCDEEMMIYLKKEADKREWSVGHFVKWLIKKYREENSKE